MIPLCFDTLVWFIVTDVLEPLLCPLEKKLVLFLWPGNCLRICLAAEIVGVGSTDTCCKMSGQWRVRVTSLNDTVSKVCKVDGEPFPLA